MEVSDSIRWDVNGEKLRKILMMIGKITSIRCELVKRDLIPVFYNPKNKE